jgi:membrane protein YdbS with pleckstrin-like domain
MTVAADQHEFEIDRDKVYAYALAFSTLLIALLGFFMLCGVGVVLAPVWYFAIGPRVVRRQVDALRYWLDGSTLRINQGFIFVGQKAIPLDRVTDVVLAQGPLLRRYGIWTLGIQTAGTGGQAAEGQLYGVVHPEQVRDLILRLRDEVTDRNRSGA